MKRVLFLFLIYHPLVYANALRNDYLNIYVDQLISEFDKKLETNSLNLFENPLYLKIIAGRYLLEEKDTISDYATKSLLTVQDNSLYQQVVKEVEREAKKINWNFGTGQKGRLYIYPSSGPDGNLTGNTYPPNTWSFTFDDGPRAQRTKSIVDHFYGAGVKTSFFMLTSQAKRYPDTVQYVLDNQMEIALHSYTHANLNKANYEKLDYEISKAMSDLYQQTNTSIHYFRLPYGAGMRNQEVRSLIAKEKLVHVFWNVDTLDWKDKDPKSIVKRALLQMDRTPNKSGIILFHDIHPQTVIASKELLDLMLERQLNICAVGDVTNYINGKESDCQINAVSTQEKK